MDKVCYKVVSVSDDGRYLSALAPFVSGENVLQYMIGLETVPKIGRIFVFGILKDAQNSSLCINVIMVGLAKDVRIQRKVSHSINDMKFFWDNWKENPTKLRIRLRMADAPKGTLTCSSFTPTELINVEGVKQ